MDRRENNTYCRLKSVKMKDFKNVKEAKIDFDNVNIDNFISDDNKSSVTGIYGPNGVGKTTVLTAIEILRNALHHKRNYSFDTKSPLIGRKICYDNWIVRWGCDHAELEFDLIAYNDEENNNKSYYNISYSFKLRRIETMNPIDNLNPKTGRREKNIKDFTIVIYDETIKYDGNDYRLGDLRKKVLFSTEEKYCNNNARPFGSQISTKKQDNFANKDKFYESIVDNKETEIFLNKIKNDIKQEGSFLFYPEVYNLIAAKISDNDYFVYKALKCYGKCLIIVPAEFRKRLFSEDATDVLFPEDDDIDNFITLDFGERKKSRSSLIGEPENLSARIEKLNNAMQKIVKDFELKVEYEDIEGDNKKNLYHLYSAKQKNSETGEEIKFPLSEESLGIKKLVTFVLGFQAVMENKKYTLVVDEIESGIYDVLLCKILNDIYEKGKGQLIFTAHNLSPLELREIKKKDGTKKEIGLDYKCIRFATYNQDNKYIKIPIKGNSNLRDKYIDLIINQYNNDKNKELADLYVEDLDTDSIF